MPETTVRIAVLLLAAAFMWAAAAKFFAFPRWKAVIARYGLPAPIDRIAVPLVPVAELAIAIVMLFISARVGAAAAVGALALFSLAVLRARSINGDRLPCGCFGGTEERHYQTMIWRNTGLGVLAAVVLLARDEPAAIGTPASPEGAELLPAALAVFGGIVVLWTAWQVGAAFRRREDP